MCLLEGSLDGVQVARAMSPLLKHMSDYMRGIMFENHYGPGYNSCPASGMLAAEMADGRHLEVLEVVWGIAEDKILYGDAARQHPLDPDEMDLLREHVACKGLN